MTASSTVYTATFLTCRSSNIIYIKRKRSILHTHTHTHTYIYIYIYI